MIRVEPRTHVPTRLAIVAPLFAAAVVLMLAPLALAISGQSVLAAYRLLADAVVGSPLATLARATELTLTGLAATIAFRVGLRNLGGEGQFLAGALAAVGIGAAGWRLSAELLTILAVIGGVLAGALMMAVPTALKVKLGTDESLVTLILNVIALLVVAIATSGQIESLAAYGVHQTFPLSVGLPFAGPAQGMRAVIGLAAACVACLAAFLVIRYTIVGFGMRATGGNPSAARFSGIAVDRVWLSVGLVSGALAGLAGAGFVTGIFGDTAPAITAGAGYAGLAVAILAGRGPLAVIPAAVFVAMLTGSPLADIAVALTLLAALLAAFLTRYRVSIVRSGLAVP